MKRYALWVEFDVKPGAMPAFLEAARLDAGGSMTHERGCRRFDVLSDPSAPQRVCFYEVYDDEVAFLAHREMPHFKAYVAATEDLVSAKSVARLTVEESGAAGGLAARNATGATR